MKLVEIKAQVYERTDWPAVAVNCTINKLLVTKRVQSSVALLAFPHSLQDWIHSSAQHPGLAPRTFVEGQIIQTSLHSLTGFKSL